MPQPVRLHYSSPYTDKVFDLDWTDLVHLLWGVYQHFGYDEWVTGVPNIESLVRVLFHAGDPDGDALLQTAEESVYPCIARFPRLFAPLRKDKAPHQFHRSGTYIWDFKTHTNPLPSESMLFGNVTELHHELKVLETMLLATRAEGTRAHKQWKWAIDGLLRLLDYPRATKIELTIDFID